MVKAKLYDNKINKNYKKNIKILNLNKNSLVLYKKIYNTKI